jgi:hypothetical protein
MELLHRAILKADQNARIKVQRCLYPVVSDWLRRHPSREALFCLDNEENYVGVAFERFWRVIIDRHIEFDALATALGYLQVCLNGVIVDRLRVSSRPKEIPLPGSAFPGEPLLKDVTFGAQIWEHLQRKLLNVREHRLAYLLFQCGFKPGEIYNCYSQEFSDVNEIYRLRCDIIEQICVLKKSKKPHQPTR